MDDARVVHQDVEPAERVGGKARDLLCGSLIHSGEIGLHGGGLAPECLDLRGGLFRGVAAIGQRHVRTGGGKAEGNALADARRAAGDKGTAACQVERSAHVSTGSQSAALLPGRAR